MLPLLVSSVSFQYKDQSMGREGGRAGEEGGIEEGKSEGEKEGERERGRERSERGRGGVRYSHFYVF